MAKFIGKIKNSVSGIHWPSRKEIVSDTLFTVMTTVVLVLLVYGWTSGIEHIMNWVVSLF